MNEKYISSWSTEEGDRFFYFGRKKHGNVTWYDPWRSLAFEEETRRMNILSVGMMYSLAKMETEEH